MAGAAGEYLGNVGGLDVGTLGAIYLAVFIGAPRPAVVRHLIAATHWRIVVVESDATRVRELRRMCLASRLNFSAYA